MFHSWTGVKDKPKDKDLTPDFPGFIFFPSTLLFFYAKKIDLTPISVRVSLRPTRSSRNTSFANAAMAAP
jgi:hypothetical protein